MKLLSEGHTEAKYSHGIMCKAWNNCIMEKAHQPSNTFKAEKYIFLVLSRKINVVMHDNASLQDSYENPI